MIPLENRPCRSSTIESMPPTQSVQIDRHATFAVSLTVTVTV
jgi:hypothetical protein